MNKNITVSVNLNHDQRTVLEKAVQGTELKPVTRNGLVEVTAENVLGIRDAVQALLDKKLAQKNATIIALETSYHCQTVISKINSVLSQFDIVEDNDNVIGLVNIDDAATTEEVEPKRSRNKSKEKDNDTEGFS